ncbi:MAG: hypothetical protein SO170_08930 [Butyribacter sp.]|nr:hypothetical protein [Butyribacter sp.]
MKNNISTRLIEILVPTYGGGVVDGVSGPMEQTVKRRKWIWNQ